MRYRPAKYRIDTLWFQWWDVRPAMFWLEVAKLVKERRVKRRSREAVQAVCEDVELMRDWRRK